MPPSLRKTHLLLGVQSIVVILLSINRLSTLTLGYVSANEFLRWVDFNNMLILPLISTIAFYLLVKHLETNPPASRGGVTLWLNLAFIVGIYLLAASYGDHEVTNYLHVRFCIPDDGAVAPQLSALCRIIIFNDDEFSHWVFFAGFTLINAAVMLYQLAFPYPEKPGRGDTALLILNGLFIGAGIFANLAFEVIGLDLYVVAALATLSFALLWRNRGQPLLVYYCTAYGLGWRRRFCTKRCCNPPDFGSFQNFRSLSRREIS